MRAELILVGDELLEDMHGVQPAYISDLLEAMGDDLRHRGHHVGRLSVVGDTPGELAPLLADAGARGVDLVLTVGGLGPTHDDRVRDEVAIVLGLGPPDTNPEARGWLLDSFSRRGLEPPDGPGPWERMAQVPGGVEPLRNPLGMAAGLAFTVGGTTHVFSLPGVTFEALEMWRTGVLPAIDRLGGTPDARARAVLTVRGAGEGTVGPVVEAYVKDRPGIRARVNLMEIDGTRFRSIRVTLSGAADEVEAASIELARDLRSLNGVDVVVGEAGGP